MLDASCCRNVNMKISFYMRTKLNINFIAAKVSSFIKLWTPVVGVKGKAKQQKLLETYYFVLFPKSPKSFIDYYFVVNLFSFCRT